MIFWKNINEGKDEKEKGAGMEYATSVCINNICGNEDANYDMQQTEIKAIMKTYPDLDENQAESKLNDLYQKYKIDGQKCAQGIMRNMEDKNLDVVMAIKMGQDTHDLGDIRLTLSDGQKLSMELKSYKQMGNITWQSSEADYFSSNIATITDIFEQEVKDNAGDLLKFDTTVEKCIHSEINNDKCKTIKLNSNCTIHCDGMTYIDSLEKVLQPFISQKVFQLSGPRRSGNGTYNDDSLNGRLIRKGSIEIDGKSIEGCVELGVDKQGNVFSWLPEESNGKNIPESAIKICSSNDGFWEINNRTTLKTIDIYKNAMRPWGNALLSILTQEVKKFLNQSEYGDKLLKNFIKTIIHKTKNRKEKGTPDYMVVYDTKRGATHLIPGGNISSWCENNQFECYAKSGINGKIGSQNKLYIHIKPQQEGYNKKKKGDTEISLTFRWGHSGFMQSPTLDVKIKGLLNLINIDQS